jgi:flagellar protein FliO/FliZ
LIELVVRIGFSLLVVLALMWVLARVSRKRVGGRHSDALSVLSRQSLSRGSSVAVVRVVDRAYVLGVTETQVTLLGETDLVALERHQEAEQRAAVALAEDASGVVTVVAQPAAPGNRPPSLGRAAMLDGSLLSGKTWRSLLDFLRERTARA